MKNPQRFDYIRLSDSRDGTLCTLKPDGSATAWLGGSHGQLITLTTEQLAAATLLYRLPRTLVVT